MRANYRLARRLFGEGLGKEAMWMHLWRTAEMKRRDFR